MTTDAQPDDLVASIGSPRLKRDPYLIAGISTGLILIFALAFAAKRDHFAVTVLEVLPCAVALIALLWLVAWAMAREATGLAFRIDAAGMHIAARKATHSVAWTDVEATALTPIPPRGQAVVATLRPGAPRPKPNVAGMRWSPQLRCLVVLHLDVIKASPEAVRTALVTHAADRFHPDGRL